MKTVVGRSSLLNHSLSFCFLSKFGIFIYYLSTWILSLACSADFLIHSDEAWHFESKSHELCLSFTMVWAQGSCFSPCPNSCWLKESLLHSQSVSSRPRPLASPSFLALLCFYLQLPPLADMLLQTSSATGLIVFPMSGLNILLLFVEFSKLRVISAKWTNASLSTKNHHF